MFQRHEDGISTRDRDKGLVSDKVLARLRPDLLDLEFEVESGKQKGQKIDRPVLFGENGKPALRYNVDAWHDVWRAGLEIEAGRAVMGNAVYRDLIQALVMVNMEHLILAVPNLYRYKGGVSEDYTHTVGVADALYGHSRVQMPFSLCVIGY